MKTLQEILKEHNLNITTNPRYGTDKGDPKTFVDGFYQEKFEPLRNKKLTLVEIGVRSGASLKLWKEFFSKRQRSLVSITSKISMIIKHHTMRSGCLMVFSSSMVMDTLRKP